MQSSNQLVSENEEKKGPAPWTLAALAFFIGLLASLANMLNYSDYAHFGGEIVILLVVLALVALFLGGLVKVAQPRLSILFIGLIVAWLIDLNATVTWTHIGLITLGVGLLAWFNERATLQLTAAAFASVLVFQTFDLATADLEARNVEENESAIAQETTQPDADRPPIIHLILDAYLGIEGMQVDGTDFDNVHAEQEAFFARHGFTVFPQAYSQHVKTVNALPHMLSYGTAPFATERQNLQYTVAPSVNYFPDLDERGYQISMRTPSFVDFCPNQPTTSCINYNRNKLGSLINTDLGAFDRAQIIGFNLFYLSRMSGRTIEATARGINKLLGTNHRSPYNQIKLSPLIGGEQLDRFIDDLSTLKHGEARIMHVLIPHDPFMMNPDCSVRPASEWSDEHGPAPIQQRETGFADNVRCLQTKLDAMMDALDKTEAGRDAIVMLHGDHGARVVEVVPYVEGPELSDRDLAITHSAMFAVRLSDKQADTRMGRYPIHKLMQAWKDGDFQTLETPEEPPAQYHLMDVNWIPREVRKLPVFPSPLTKN